MNYLTNVLLIVFAFFFMEGVAWFTHKYIMHGVLWSWHKSHHEQRHGIFELNDLFAVVFGSIGAALIIYGSLNFDFRFFLGLGISFYGIAYFLVHDIFVHQRLKMFKNTNSIYFKAMRFAHKIHHKTSTKDGAEAFGFLFVPKRYIKKYQKD